MTMRPIRSRTLWCATAGVLALANAGQAQDNAALDDRVAAEASTAANSDGQTITEVVVTGTRRSLEDALATKRSSREIVDSISAEGIGRLPDLNLAESLQRVPGVQINRSANRRQGTVSIRGLPGDFSQTLINGQYLASPDVSNFSYGTVRSEVFSGIDVVKAQGADQPTGGLSGLINLRTGSAMAAEEGLTFSADGTYEELTEELAPGAAISGAYQIIPDTLAVRAAVGYKSSNFRIDNFQINTYDRIAGSATPDNADDVLRPREVRLPNQRVESDSISASLGLEWRATDQLTAELFGFFNDFSSDADQNEYLIQVQPTSVVTTLGAAQPSGAFGQTITGMRVQNPQINVDTRLLSEEFKTSALTSKLTWTNDDWTVAGTAHYTKATRDFRTQGYQAIQRSVAGGNGFTVDLDTGAGNLGAAVFRLSPSSAQLVNLQQAFGAPIAPTYRELRAVNTPGASFLGGFRNQDESEDEASLALDVGKLLSFGPIGGVRAGAIYRDKSQDQTQSLAGLFGVDPAAFSNAFYGYSLFSGGADYLNGRAGAVDMTGYGQLNVRAITAALTPVAGTPAGSVYFIGPEGLVNFYDSTALSLVYDNEQTIYGGYALVDFDYDLSAAISMSGNAGLRYEKSERDTTAQFQPDVFSFDYDNALPLVHLVIEFGDDWVLRTSYTETLRRPQVDSFAVLRSVAVDGTGQIVTANLGAGDLEPFTSENVDVSLEWYNREGSSVSLLGFRKKVKDYAGTTRICPENGGDFGFGPLTTASGVCRTVNATPAQGSFPAVLAGATVNINVTANQDTFTLSGYEFSVQQNLDFLPAPWSGFGGQINYTYVDYDSDSNFRLGEISEDTVNAILYYEVPRFGVRAAYNYRSEYFLASGGTQTGADRSVKARYQLDLSASVNITDRFSVTADAFNVTNEQLLEFEGAENRVRNYFEYGRTYSLGARYRF